MVKPTFFVIGDIILDTTCFGECQRLSPEAPIPVFQKRSTTSVLGGAGNVARNLKAIIPEATIYLEGFLSEEYIGLCKESGIEDKYVMTDYPARRTNIKLRYIDEKTGYQLLRVDNEEKAGCISMSLDSKSTAQHIIDCEPDGAILSDYNKGTITEELAEEVISDCVSMGIPTFIDTRRTDFTCFYRADYFTPNAQEYQVMREQFDGDGPKILEALESRGILETRGHEGMNLHLLGGITYHVDSINKDVLDVTGAGDSALAGFAAMRVLQPDGDPAEAMRVANMLAGSVCMVRGTNCPAYNLKELGIKY